MNAAGLFEAPFTDGPPDMSKQPARELIGAKALLRVVTTDHKCGGEIRAASLREFAGACNSLSRGGGKPAYPQAARGQCTAAERIASVTIAFSDRKGVG